MRKILGVLEVFLGVFEKTKEKKDRDVPSFRFLGSVVPSFLFFYPRSGLGGSWKICQNHPFGKPPFASPRHLGRKNHYFQGPLNGGVSNGGGFPIWACPSFFVLFGTFPFFFRDFPDLSGDSSGIFPICPFPLSRPINSAYEEQSRKGLRHNLDLSRKKWETPRFGNPPA